MEPSQSEIRNFNSISPSAKSLLFMKGHTTIPYAQKTAELMAQPGQFQPDFKNRDTTFWARTLHFESRYLSLDQLLEGLSATNIIELSSGFSFRGLDRVKNHAIHYIDTDLPEVIAVKQPLMELLKKEEPDVKGELELLPLNVLDEDEFQKIVNRLPKGEVTILNEGLLMYFDQAEKEKLCNIIHKLLRERGGCWITADIYLKNEKGNLKLKLDSKTEEFFRQHRMEENKFESFEEAESFFNRMGFVIDKEAVVNHSQLSSLKYFMKYTGFFQLLRFRKAGKIQKSWRLKLAAS